MSRWLGDTPWSVYPCSPKGPRFADWSFWFWSKSVQESLNSESGSEPEIRVFAIFKSVPNLAMDLKTTYVAFLKSNQRNSWRNTSNGWIFSLSTLLLMAAQLKAELLLSRCWSCRLPLPKPTITTWCRAASTLTSALVLLFYCVSYILACCASIGQLQLVRQQYFGSTPVVLVWCSESIACKSRRSKTENGPRQVCCGRKNDECLDGIGANTVGFVFLSALLPFWVLLDGCSHWRRDDPFLSSFLPSSLKTEQNGTNRTHCQTVTLLMTWFLVQPATKKQLFQTFLRHFNFWLQTEDEARWTATATEETDDAAPPEQTALPFPSQKPSCVLHQVELYKKLEYKKVRFLSADKLCCF